MPYRHSYPDQVFFTFLFLGNGTYFFNTFTSRNLQNESSKTFVLKCDASESW